MASKNSLNWVTIVGGLFCILGSFGAGLSIRGIVQHINGFQAVGYVLVGGIFIAISALVITQVLSSLTGE
jgi:hypothetical protein